MTAHADPFVELAALQSEHPVVPRYEVAALRALGERAPVAIDEREQFIRRMETDPLRYSWEPEIWRQIDLRVVRKRLAHPGMVLEVFITGGMRPGKSYSCARRITAHHVYTKRAEVFCLAETLITSQKLQQQPVERFLPRSLSPDSGKGAKGKHERFKFSGGHFTNESFTAYANVQDEQGQVFRGGGTCSFRFFSQDIGTFQGFELTCAWSDELVPKSHVIAVKERMATRAGDTRDAAFLERMRQAERLLEAGKELPTALLGAIYHGVHLVSFTPYLGWNETVNYFLRNAVKTEMVEAPDLVGRPGVKDPRVPRFAQPELDTQLVAYVFTSDNKIKPAYPALSAQLREAPESEVRIKLYGDVQQDWTTVFGASYAEATHVKTWADVPRDGTVYEVLDPAGKKPWVVLYLYVDAAGRVWVVQEWPCPCIPVEGMMPGLWAVPSEGDRLNGDEGPAQKLRLRWSNRRYLRLFWELRQRLYQRFEQTGERFTGRVLEVELSNANGAEVWELKGPVVNPYDNLMDPRFAETPSEMAGEQVSLQTALADEENGIYFRKASGVTNEVGDVAIQNLLNERVLGLPGMLVVDECENTRFMLRTYAIPDFKRNTTAKDEACVDFRDVLAYGVLCGPEHVANTNVIAQDNQHLFNS